MGAELLVRLVVRALPQEEAVEVGEGRRKAVRILDLALASRGVDHGEAIPEEAGAARERRLEEPVRMDARHRARRHVRRRGAHLGGDRARQERADGDDRRLALPRDVRTQDGERIGMPACYQGFHVRGRQGAASDRWTHGSIVRGPARREAAGILASGDGSLDVRAGRVRAGLRGPGDLLVARRIRHPDARARGPERSGG